MTTIEKVLEIIKEAEQRGYECGYHRGFEDGKKAHETKKTESDGVDATNFRPLIDPYTFKTWKERL